jgi:hypothetical protein
MSENRHWIGISKSQQFLLYISYETKLPYSVTSQVLGQRWNLQRKDRERNNAIWIGQPYEGGNICVEDNGIIIKRVKPKKL